MKGSAQRDVLPVEADCEIGAEFQLTEPHAELKRQVTERLAAHRQRRAGSAGRQAAADTSQSNRPRNAVADAVAERYAQTPSYRAFLAEQARHAVEEAAAAAEVARRNAQAVAAVQQELLTELALWDAPQDFTEETALVTEGVIARAESPAVLQSAVQDGLTVRLYEDLGRAVKAEPARQPSFAALEAGDLREVQALEAEIAFRKSPVFEDYKALLEHDVEPPIPLPANLLEFPRQLVAARKARPRLAEGPLRDEAPRTQQLRIFEVEAGQISTAPSVEPPQSWTTIRLDSHSVTAPAASVEGPQMAVLASLMPPQTAPMELRMMAWLVDVGLVLGSLAAFVAAFVKVTGVVPGGQAGLIALGCTGFVFYLLYELLFFTFNDQTPGMRYARIGLCTFSDENPTRAAIRRRILAQLVAVCPLGLGLLWSFLDDDGLGWHDRISRMYQRAY